jgi:hypothetical protein
VVCRISGAPQPEYRARAMASSTRWSMPGGALSRARESLRRHALGEGSDAKAVAYIVIKNETGKLRYGSRGGQRHRGRFAKALICAINVCNSGS